MKRRKSAGVVNLPAEFVLAGWETMIDVSSKICNRICTTGEWPTPWTWSLIITLRKRATYSLARTIEMQNYQPHQLFEQSNVENLLGRLKPQAENITSEE